MTENDDLPDGVEQGRPVSEVLAEMTGRPKEDFEYNGEVPDFEELETVSADEFYDE